MPTAAVASVDISDFSPPPRSNPLVLIVYLTLQEVVMGTVRNERREHPRYRVNKDVLSINQDILAEVIDISKCGMSCRCLTSTDRPLTAITEIELLNCELGTSIESLHCRMVRSSQKTISGAFTSTLITHFSLEFQNITGSQRQQLDQFIKDNSLLETNASLH